MSHKKNQTAVLKRLYCYIRNYMALVILSLLFAAVSAVLTLYVPILTGRAIDCIVAEGNVDFAGIFAVIRRIMIVVVLTALSQWLSWQRVDCSRDGAVRSPEDIHRELWTLVRPLAEK